MKIRFISGEPVNGTGPDFSALVSLKQQLHHMSSFSIYSMQQLCITKKNDVNVFDNIYHFQANILQVNFYHINNTKFCKNIFKIYLS